MECALLEPKPKKYLIGFPKNEYALLKMIEIWRFMLRKQNKVGPIVMNLSKAFDTLKHKLLQRKL